MVVSFSHETDRTRLWSFVALLFYEAHFGPQLELAEPGVEHTVRMEIDFSPIVGPYEPVALVGKELGDAPIGQRLVNLDVSTMLAGVIFKLSPHRVESIADGNQEIFIGLAIHDQFPAWDGEVSPVMMLSVFAAWILLLTALAAESTWRRRSRG